MSDEPMIAAPADLTNRLARLESAVTNDGAFDMPELLRALWRGKWFIGGVTFVIAGIAVAILLYLPNTYRAEVLLIPAANADASSLAGLGAAGGIASLAGLRLGRDKGTEKATYAMNLLKTWGFLEKFVHDNKLEVPLMAGKRWNPDTGQLQIDPKRYDLARQQWVQQADTPANRSGEPTGWDIYKQLDDMINVDRDMSSGVITLTVEFLSPVDAKQWTDKLVIAVNQHMQAQDQYDARRNIQYLQKQIDATALTDMQKVFYSLIEEQTKNLMLAEASDEYVLKTLSPAQTPEVKFRPARAVDSILAAIAGVMLGTFLWLGILYPSRKHRYSLPPRESRI